MRDSDFQDQDEPPSEEEVLAPRSTASMAGRSPLPARRRSSSVHAATRPLLVGSALSAASLVVVALFGLGLVALLWAVL